MYNTETLGGETDINSFSEYRRNATHTLEKVAARTSTVKDPIVNSPSADKISSWQILSQDLI